MRDPDPQRHYMMDDVGSGYGSTMDGTSGWMGAFAAIVVVLLVLALPALLDGTAPAPS